MDKLILINWFDQIAGKINQNKVKNMLTVFTFGYIMHSRLTDNRTTKNRGANMYRKKDNRTDEQREADAKRKEGLRKLSKQISEMTENQKIEFCHFLSSKVGGVPTCTGERVLSPFNSCFLFMQRQDVSIVGGYKQWQSQGRKVKKGAKAMAIWVYVNGKVESDVTSEENPMQNPHFVLRNCMFDITDTEPMELGLLDCGDNTQALVLA